jgi:hypothetical protein
MSVGNAQVADRYDGPVDDDDGNGRLFLLDREPRLALWVFLAIEVVAFGFFLYAGRHRWFFHDEWTFLVTRDGGDLSSVLKPANEHWTTLPVLAYRVLFNVFGINSYLPYQLMSVSAHLVSAALLRIVMRRAGVSPWMSTLVATVFLFLGSGDHNILRAFQVTFVGALAFGLIQLILATHDGGLDWRDGVGIGAGLLALMCSGIGIAMVAAVGAAVLLARGWRPALLQVLPLALVYVAWWWTNAKNVAHDPVTVRKAASFSLAAVREGFSGISQVPGIGLLLAAVTLAGLVLAWRHVGAADVRRRAAGPAGLLFGLAVFVGLTAWSRANFGTAFAAQSRYIYIVAALALPAVAVAFDTLVRRWAILIPFAFALLLVGVPRNLDISWNQTGAGRGEASSKDVYLAFAQLPEAAGADDWIRPDPNLAPALTLGWLRAGISTGRVPAPESSSPDVIAEARFRLSLQMTPISKRLTDCIPVEKDQTVHLEQGQAVGIRNTVRVADSGAEGVPPLVFRGGTGSRLLAYRGPLDLIVKSGDAALPAELCPA